MRLIQILSVLLLGFSAFAARAQEQSPVAPERSPWAHESEVGIATVAGNTESETYNVKQKTSYAFSLNQFTLGARYLKTTAGGTESVRNWDGSIRYDRTLSTRTFAFASYSLESDVFAGYAQRNNIDTGLRYDLAKSNPTTWFAEVGYRNTTTIYAGPVGGRDKVTNFARFYSEVSQSVSETSAVRFWVEHLPSFERKDLYRINFEPSFVSQISSVFSVKAGYLVKYQNEIVAPVVKRTDRFFTTALVAKF